MVSIYIQAKKTVSVIIIKRGGWVCDPQLLVLRPPKVATQNWRSLRPPWRVNDTSRPPKSGRRNFWGSQHQFRRKWMGVAAPKRKTGETPRPPEPPGVAPPILSWARASCTRTPKFHQQPPGKKPATQIPQPTLHNTPPTHPKPPHPT